MKKISMPKQAVWQSLGIACIGLTLLNIALVHPWLRILHPLSALIILFLLPGAAVVRLLPQTDLLGTGFERFGWSILSSFLLFSTIIFTLLLQNGDVIILNQTVLWKIMGGVSSSIFLVSTVVKPLSIPEFSVTRLQRISISTLPILVIAIVLFLPYVINPIAQDNDGFLSKTIEYANNGAVKLHDLRPIFAATLASIAKITGFSIFKTFLLTPPLLFLAGIVCFWGFICRTIVSPLSRLSALLTIICAPVIAIEISITRPQVILLAYCIPLLLVTIEAVRKRSLVLAVTGLGMALLLVPFHELSTTFVLIFLLISAHLVYLRIKNGTLTIKNVGIATVVVIPYIFILHIDTIFNQASGVLEFAVRNIGSLTWRWWFINSYISIDGAQLGWPGIQALYYYLYNGLLLYIALISGILVLQKNPQRIFKSPWIPVVGFLVFFLFFAEIAPRFGFYFLLNRTWPYISLAACVCSIAIFKLIASKNQLTQLGALLAMIVISISGVLGISKVSRDNISDVSQNESGAITYLSHLRDDNIFISTQNNRTLVTLYGNQGYLQVDPLQITTKESLDALSNKATHSIITNITKTTSTRTTSVLLDGKTLSNVVGPSNLIASEISELERPNSVKSIYYIYSKRKDQGFYARRHQSYNVATPSLNLLALVKDNPVAYQDDAVIIYLLKSNPR